MPLATLLLPPALLVAGAALGWGLGLVAPRGAQPAAAAAAWLALAALLAGWFAGGGTPLDLTTPLTAGVARLVLRLDAVIVLFEVAVLLAAAPLLTFQRRTPGQAAVATLTVAMALAALTAGSMVLTALGLAAVASLALVLLHQREPAGTRHFWLALTAAWLLLLWTASLLEVRGGTSVYGAVPVTAMGVPVFALLALAAVLCAGLLPWRTWVSEVATRSSPEAGPLVVAVLVPLGLYPLARVYGLGAGQLPSPALNLVLSALGVATAVGAAVRAQAASTRSGYLAEAVPFAAGLLLVGLGLGTPLGLVAALTGLLGLAVAAGLGPLVPAGRGPAALLGIAAAAGAPPTIAFGSWLLTVQASIEAGPVSAFLGLAAAGAWLLSLAAGARGLRLSGEPDRGSGPGTISLVVLALLAGAALTGLIALLAVPAAAELMPTPAGRAAQPALSPAAILAAGSLAVSTASGGWAAMLLASPLALLGLLAAGLVRLLPALRPVARPSVLTLEPEPEPLFRPPLAGAPERLLRACAGLRLPEQYRSLFQPAVIERGMTAGRPWFWVAATLVLAIAVTR